MFAQQLTKFVGWYLRIQIIGKWECGQLYLNKQVLVVPFIGPCEKVKTLETRFCSQVVNHKFAYISRRPAWGREIPHPVHATSISF